jgi:hypothetical protein
VPFICRYAVATYVITEDMPLGQKSSTRLTCVDFGERRS